MNLFLRLLAVGSLLTAATSFAANAFEGKISLAMSAGKSKPQVLNFSFKDNKQRTDIEVDGNTMAMITDLEKLETLMLMPEQKMYMVMPFKKAAEKALAEADKRATDSNPDIVFTGKTETILGYKCEQMIVKDKDTTTEAWVAEGLGVFTGMGNQGGGGGMGAMFGGGRNKSAAAAKWEEALKGKGGFPLRVITQDKKSKETFRLEATKIEPGSLPASLFQPPAGWQKFDMGNMLKGFGG